MTSAAYHAPVLAREIAALAAGAERVFDGTVGGGGHAELFRASGARVLAADRDPDALAAAKARLGDSEMEWIPGRFGSEPVLEAVRRFQPQFVLLDLGVSSHQLDEDPRGFSFRPGAPLDMRMTPGDGPSAAELLNTLPQADLARVFAEYGDEPRARKLAADIVRRRGRAPFATSDDLVNAIRGTLGPRSGPKDFARLFQAVRMEVNDERGELARALPALLEALAPGGILSVITYHSGEDRLVKHTFREWSRSCVCPPALPVCACRGRPLGSNEPRRSIQPSEEEVAANSRARSARLRVFRKAHGG
jgi:16S rRNA (cytosine1402-N4)-methyltransferase